MSSAAVAEGRRGRTRGLTELYERNGPQALRLAYLITSDPDLAQDIVQEAFVRVASRFHHLRMPEHFDAYLRRTVVNLCKLPLPPPAHRPGGHRASGGAGAGPDHR